MPDILSAQNLLAELKKQAAAIGLKTRDGAAQELVGEVETISAKWWLGGRKVTYRMSCRLTEADHTAHVREAVVERSWGIPPPTLTVEKTTVRGWKRSGERTDVSVGGGGKLDYGRARDAMAKAVAAAGWKFQFEGGRMPA
jgi:hypothetical protein